MVELARWSLDDGGEVLVEIAQDGPEISPVSRTGDLIQSAGTSLGSALSSVRDASSTILGQFRDAAVRPDKIEVEFGVHLSTQVGAVIAKSSLDGHLTVKLSWEGDRAP
ncbi:CU044_2847 family protein [Streptomyces sp. NBC_00448]|uniref:CU044_2847 family protein n=1 Tax=Streptomyces sp. NBC_00448 TaxID=2903652 RepID=UPI002E1ABCA0